MSALSIIARLLLSMALIVNGSAGAMVGAHAMTDHAQPQPARHVDASGAVSGHDENTGLAFSEQSSHHIQGLAAPAGPSGTPAATRGHGTNPAPDSLGSAGPGNAAVR